MFMGSNESLAIACLFKGGSWFGLKGSLNYVIGQVLNSKLLFQTMPLLLEVCQALCARLPSLWSSLLRLPRLPMDFCPVLICHFLPCPKVFPINVHWIKRVPSVCLFVLGWILICAKRSPGVIKSVIIILN